MHITVTVPEYLTQLPFVIDPTIPLNTYSWIDIVSGNIICCPDLQVSIQCLEAEGVSLDCTKSALELNLSEFCLITVHVHTCSCQELHSCKQSPLFCSEVEPTELPEPEQQSVTEPIPYASEAIQTE